MKVGLYIPIPDDRLDVAFIARKAEDLGFESLWCSDHPIMPVHTKTPFPYSPDGIIPESFSHYVDPYVALGRASAVTKTIKLGTSITLVPERNPLLLAKEIATLDLFSGGRFLFGVGAGWLREETEIMGGDFDHRWTQIREAVLAMKELWTKEEAEFHGRYYDFPPIRSYPKPVQKPHPPVILGGRAKNVLKRVVTWGDGWIPSGITPEEVKESRAILDNLAAEAGRDPKSITISVHYQPPDLELFKRYFEAGAYRVVLGPPLEPHEGIFGLDNSSEEAMSAEMERAAEAVLR